MWPDLEHPQALLQKTAVFSTLDDSEVAALVARMSASLFTAGEVIVQQGDHSTSMYIVAEGLLHVYIHQADAGETIRVGQLAAGAFFGEISLLTGDPRTATIKAAVDSYVYEITRCPFHKFAASYAAARL